MADVRASLPIDETHTVMLAAVNNRLGLAITDSGAYQTIMDHRMAAAFGSMVRQAVNGDCGSYSVPGSGVEHDYAGVVEGGFVLRLGEFV